MSYRIVTIAVVLVALVATMLYNWRETSKRWMPFQGGIFRFDKASSHAPFLSKLDGEEIILHPGGYLESWPVVGHWYQHENLVVVDRLRDTRSGDFKESWKWSCKGEVGQDFYFIQPNGDIVLAPRVESEPTPASKTYIVYRKVNEP